MIDIKEKLSSINPVTKFLPIIILIQFLPLLKVLLKDGRPSINGDSAFYQHAGWYNLNGGIPYETMWDPKTPLNFVYTTFTAFLGGDNMLIIHYINILTGMIVTVLICWIVGLIVYEISSDRNAAILSSLSCLCLPLFHALFAAGYRPKYLFLLFGLLGILLSLKDYYLLGMLSAAISTGFWQFGVIMMLCVVIITTNNKQSKYDIAYAFLGGIIGTFIVVTPSLLWGGFESMLINTIFSPIMSDGGGSLILNIGIIVSNLEYLNLMVVLVFGGVTLRAIYDMKNREFGNIWFYVLLLSFLLQSLFLDFDSFTDFMPIYVILCIGVGFTYVFVSNNVKYSFWVIIITSLVITTILGGGTGVIFEDYSKTEPGKNSNSMWDNSLREVGSFFLGNITFENYGTDSRDIPELNRRSYMDNIYWEKIKPGVCHYRVGNMHRQWMINTEQSYEDERCLNDFKKFVKKFVL